MLGKINLQTYERCYPKRLKKFFQSNLNCKTYNEFIPNMKRAVVGNLPKELLAYAATGIEIKALQNQFTNIANILRAEYHRAKFLPEFCFLDKNYKPSPILRQIAKKTGENFTRQINRFTTEELQLKLDYVDHGSFANVYKMSILDKNGKKIMHDKALKIYHSVSEPVKTHTPMHNTYAEANFWTYLKFHTGHPLDKTQFTKHYITDLKSGYCLTEFIDDKIPRTTNPINFRNLLKINYADAFYNQKIGGKIYDGGGFEKFKGFTGDKVVLRYFKKLYYRNSEKDLKPVLENLEKEANNPKNEHRTKIRKAIDLFLAHKKTT